MLSQSQPLPGSSSLLTEVLCHYQEKRQGADLEHCYPGDISQPLDIHSSWISVPLCLASLKVYIAQVNQNLVLLKTLAFPNITNSTNLPWVHFSGTMAFPIKSLLHSRVIVGCSIPPLPVLFQAEEQWGAGMSRTPFDPFVTLLPQSLSPSRMRWTLPPCPMSLVPTAELAAPSGGNPEPRPCFSWKIAWSSPTHKAGGRFSGRGFWLREG